MKLKAAAFALCTALGLAGAANAESRSSFPQSLPGWEAVGRLNIGGRNMCTGTLIDQRLVLTAAHCLYDPNTGRAIDPSSITFEAGLNGSRPKATRGVSKAAIHPGYRFSKSSGADVGSDLAVLRLESPISERQIRPIRLDMSANRGDRFDVLAYSYRQSTRPQRQRGCEVLAKQNQTLVMSCRVEYGASGAPVFAVTAGRAPRLVSVVAAKAAIGARPVSLGTVLDGTLWQLMRTAG